MLLDRQLEKQSLCSDRLVMLIGLAAKNAILIVEFARAEQRRGKPLIEATWKGRVYGYAPF